MKRTFTILLCAMLIASFAACGQAGASSVPSSSDPALSVAEPGPSAAAASEDDAPDAASDPLFVADAALYRGTVEEFAVDDEGRTVLLLRRAVGTAYTPTLKVALTDDTQYSFDNTQLGNGAFLEIYYGVSEGETPEIVEAVAVNQLMGEEAVYYNGKLVELAPDPEKEGEGYLLMDPLEENGMQYRFNYGPETQFYLDFDALKPGDLLNVYHSPISTRSIPPQSPAFEVAPYTAPQEGELPQPAAEAPAPDSVLTPAGEAASQG